MKKETRSPRAGLRFRGTLNKTPVTHARNPWSCNKKGWRKYRHPSVELLTTMKYYAVIPAALTS
ncbi:MAG TPA: hypothetical protein VN852_01490, partial [Candidatus Krumholzibacteria bacterium]|nr:hypothetical protein [Candidatus Krumholzibacteria bacterium]